MEGDALQLEVHGLELLPLVLLIEEARVGEPRPDHLLVALDDGRAAVLRLQVGHQREVVRELAALPFFEREALLVRLDRGDDHLRRHLQELLVEGADEHARPFGEPCVLREQPLVLDEGELGFRRTLARFRQDALGAGGRLEDHLLCFQRLPVVGEALDHDRLAAAEEAMPARGIAARHPFDLEGHDLAVEEAEDRLHGAHPARRALAPAHGLGPGELAHHLRHQLGDDLGSGAAGLMDRGDVIIALLGILDDLRVLDGPEAGGLEETGDRVIGRADTGALPLLADLGRFCRQPLDGERQPPRGSENFRRAALDTGRLQAFEHQPLQGFRRLALHAGGDLLGQDLKQKLGHGNGNLGGKNWVSNSYAFFDRVCNYT